jgi:hypothetical protein
MAENFRFGQQIFAFCSYRFCGFVDALRSEAIQRGWAHR